ncbi:MAG TPA: hypothetical protein PKB14_13845 [Rubrivivax sp.]|nr:hypothetical protein [Rubrivivax sp.]
MNRLNDSAWVEMVLEPMWICLRASELASRCVDAELLADARTLTDFCLEPSEPRLNPLEFHGKGRAAPRRKPEGEAVPAPSRARYRLLA